MRPQPVRTHHWRQVGTPPLRDTQPLLIPVVGFHACLSLLVHSGQTGAQVAKCQVRVQLACLISAAALDRRDDSPPLLQPSIAAGLLGQTEAHVAPDQSVPPIEELREKMHLSETSLGVVRGRSWKNHPEDRVTSNLVWNSRRRGATIIQGRP